MWKQWQRVKEVFTATCRDVLGVRRVEFNSGYAKRNWN